MGIKGRLKTFVIGILILTPQLSYGWGRDGHEIVAAIGSSQTYSGKSFWNANLLNMVKLSTVPDSHWKVGPSQSFEAPTHFFQPDSYYPSPSQFNLIPRDPAAASAKFGAANFIKWGTTTWRINQLYQAALTALKNRDFKTALQMAGTMSHYVGDLSQPMHVTENYNGQFSGNIGIHKFFETDIVKRNKTALFNATNQQTAQLIKNPEFQKQFSGTVVDVAFNEVNRAYALKDLLLQTDKQFGRLEAGVQKQLPLVRDRLADGSATLAIILSHLWEESGLKDEGATVDVQIPQWVPPNYYPPEAFRLHRSHLMGEDHCND